MIDYFDLTGKTAVITGGNRGLGLGISKALVAYGANVAVVSTKTNPGVEIELRAAGAEGIKVRSYEFDLGDFDAYDGLVAQVISDFGEIDILVNNAGVQRRSPAVDFSVADWDFVVDIDMKAPFLLCQKVGKQMLARGNGKIINIASLLSFQGGLTVPAYAAAKHGVSGFTKALSNEWAAKGININAIAPGYMSTEMNEALLQDKVRSEQILSRIPAGRWGNPDDIAGTAVFLSSAASDYINGFTIAVDGGWLGR